MGNEVGLGFTPTCVVDCASADETVALAARFAQVVRGGDIVSLEGELGAGKTFFTRHVAAALGTTDRVSSPTFVLQKTYTLTAPDNNDNAPTKMAHYDTYRLGSYAELADIGFEDADDDTVSVVEWGDRFAADYPPDTLIRIHIAHTGQHARRFALALPPGRTTEIGGH